MNYGVSSRLLDNFENPLSVDSFGRLRVSNPQTIFDTKQIDQESSVLLVPTFTENNGTAIYSAERSSTALSTSTDSGSRSVRQSRRRFNYQPGKALRHGEPVLTTNGWINIENIQVGDEVFDGLGMPTQVVGVYPQGVRTIYRIIFDDGTHVDCDGEHLWKTIGRQNSQKGSARILTTLQMLEEYGEEPPAFARWRIPSAPILQFQEIPVPVDPYTLGAILGDGHIDKNSSFVSFTSADEEVIQNLKAEITKHKSKYHYGILKMAPHIQSLGLAKRIAYNKFVPDCYKYNSNAVRLGILQGLMDTDGDVDKRCGTASYTTVSSQLADDVVYLIRSLGGQAKIKTRYTKYTNADGDRVKGTLSYRISVIMPECPFRLGRKAFYWKPRTRISFDRYIHSIKMLGEYNATCIRVASEDHTLITRGHIVTHNSQFIFMTFKATTTAVNTDLRVGLYDGYNGVFFSLTDGPNPLWNLRSDTSGFVDTISVNQDNWNFDKLDGLGVSGITLNPTKCQIMFIAFEWLGTGSVVTGFVIDGKLVPAHVFKNANNSDVVYMRTPNLPLRWEAVNTDTSTGGSLESICGTVISEGGTDNLGVRRSHYLNSNTSITSGSVNEIISIRLRGESTSDAIAATTFATVFVEAYSALITSNDTGLLLVGYNPTFTGAGTWGDPVGGALGSAVQVCTSGRAVTNPGLVMASEFSSAQVRTGNADFDRVLALGAAPDTSIGDVISLMLANTSGTTTTVRASLTWRELL